MEGIQHKMISANGINMHIAEKGEGLMVLFIHCFPELWYSWRHQILYMAAQGYRAVVPDLHGYSDTTGAPVGDFTKFTTLHVVGDIIALLDAIAPDEDKVFVVGHDCGAYVAWFLCQYRPERVKALVSLSIHFMPRIPTTKPVDMFRGIYGNDHYVNRFQVSGDIEAKFAQIGVRRVVKKFITYRDPSPFRFPKGKGFGAGDSFDTPVILPYWLSEDVDYYANKFEKN